MKDGLINVPFDDLLPDFIARVAHLCCSAKSGHGCLRGSKNCPRTFRRQFGVLLAPVFCHGDLEHDVRSFTRCD